MDEPVLLVDRRAGIEILTLNRPDRRNALNPALTGALLAALKVGDRDDAVRAFIITGAGTAFCAGMDLKAFSGGEKPPPPDAENVYSFRTAKPVIAAVNGPAVAGGFELVLASDIVVAARDAFFALPEVKRGLIAGGGGAFRLVRLAGRARAVEMLLTGSAISADEAREAGIVRQVVEVEDVLPAALSIARRIAQSAPSAVAETLALARQAEDLPERDLWRLSAGAWSRVVDSDEAREGAAAFLEKRTPDWGRDSLS